MIQIGIAILLFLGIAYFISEHSRQKRLAEKEQELKNAEMDSDLLDIDKNIEEERVHQRSVKQDIEDLKQGDK